MQSELKYIRLNLFNLMSFSVVYRAEQQDNN